MINDGDFGSDDSIRSDSCSDSEDEEGEVVVARKGLLRGAHESRLDGAAPLPPAADGCASSAAPQSHSKPKDISPHAHRGAHRPPRHRGISEDSRSHYKREIEWVEEGAKEDLINQEFDCHSLHHPEVQSDWSSFIQDAANDSKEKKSAAVAPAASGIPQHSKPSWDRAVGHVPTMVECPELNFMDEFGTVEDASEAMRTTGQRHGTSTLLWGGEKVKKNGITTSALWVCKCDVMQFSTYLHQKQHGDAPSGPLPGFNAEKACSSAMRGQGQFVLFLQFLRDHPTEVCGFFCLAQRATRE